MMGNLLRFLSGALFYQTFRDLVIAVPQQYAPNSSLNNMFDFIEGRDWSFVFVVCMYFTLLGFGSSKYLKLQSRGIMMTAVFYVICFALAMRGNWFNMVDNPGFVVRFTCWFAGIVLAWMFGILAGSVKLEHLNRSAGA